MQQLRSPTDWPRRFAGFTGTVSLILGILVLLGWAADLALVVQLLPRWRPMAVTTALGFIGTGVALLGVVRGRPVLAWAALVPMLLGSLATVQEYFSLELPGLLSGTALPNSSAPPARLSGSTAVCFILTGLNLLVLRRPCRHRERPLFVSLSASVVAALGLVIFLGNLAGIDAMSDPGRGLRMAVHTSAAFALLGGAVFALAWREGTAFEGGAPRWLPLPVTLGVSAGAIVLWQALLVQEVEQVGRLTTAAASNAAREIYPKLQYQVIALNTKGKAWDRDGNPPKTYGELVQEVGLEYAAGVQALERIEPPCQLRWISPVVGNEGLLHADPTYQVRRRSALDAAQNANAKGRRAGVSQTFRLPTGEKGFSVSLPWGDDSALIMVFHAQDLLEQILRANIARGYGITVLDGEQEIYRRRYADAATERSWAREASIDLEGVPWRVRVWPTPELLAQTRSPLPTFALVIELAMALVLGLAVSLAQTGRLRARQLSDANQHLTTEIAERRRAEEALRSTEERYRRFFDEDLAGAAITRADGQYIACNPAYARMFGFSSVEDVLASTSKVLYASPEARRLVLDELRRQKRLEARQIEYRRKDGKTLYAIANLVGTFDDRGELTEIKSYVWDNTDRITLERQYYHSQKLEAVGRLAGGVAHDFNNLLTVINGYSDVALRDLPTTDPLHEAITQIKRAGERAAILTRQLLAFSRKQLLQPQILSLNSLVGEMDRMLHRLIGEDIELRTELDPGIWPIKADPGQIEQVLVNIVVNARDAMPDGGQLFIRTANVTPDPDNDGTDAHGAPRRFVLLAITDTGCGMDEKTRAQLFEPFFTTKAVGKGTGLGLATVYGIVQQSGGHITVESEPGKGSTLRIFLPSVGDVVAVKPGLPNVVPPANGHETILLVEDEDTVRALARRTLVERGYRVLEAKNGEEALALCAQPIHLLVTDVIMPQMNGRELARRLRAERPTVRVLYLSGYTDDTLGRLGVLDGGVAFLAKPFSADSLVRKVRELLDGPPPSRSDVSHSNAVIR